MSKNGLPASVEMGLDPDPPIVQQNKTPLKSQAVLLIVASDAEVT